METPEYLLSALRQYQHNDGSGIVHGFDHDETIAAVEKLCNEQRQKTIDTLIVELKSMGFQLYDIGEQRLRNAGGEEQ